MCSKCPTPSGGFFNQYLSRYNSSAINVNTDTSSASNVITRTQAFRRSLPNQWAQSQLECFNADQLSMLTGTQAFDLSMLNQWARSPQRLLSRSKQYGVAKNVRPYNPWESHIYLGFISYKLTLIDIITSFTSIYIYNVINLINCVT